MTRSDNIPPIADRGILLACDMDQEWMLKWWWDNYSRHNDLPVHFIDMDLSANMRKWCAQVGTISPLSHKLPYTGEPTEEDKARWESIYAGPILTLRKKMLLKPYALEQSPFTKTLYLDNDTQVLTSLQPLFELDTPFAICPEPIYAQSLDDAKGVIESGHPLYNSGVTLYTKGTPILNQWIDLTNRANHKYMGDENVLTDVIYNHSHTPYHLDPIWNWRPSQGENPHARIIHHVASHGKRTIRRMLPPTQPRQHPE